MTTGPRRPASLPMDLLLEIMIARCDDVTTVVRCATTSKTMFRAILAFLVQRAKSNGGFDPGLLTAVTYTCCTYRTSSVVVQPPAALRRLGTDLLAVHSSKPMASRDGLVVLFQNRRTTTTGRGGERVVFDGILVANTTTGGVTSLPSMGPPRRGTSTDGMYFPALLSVSGAGAGRSFELLVVYRHDGDDDDDWSLVTQTFSSRQGIINEWGAARVIDIHGMPPRAHRLQEASWSMAPAVVGRSVHWLCYTQVLIQQTFSNGDLIILALHADSAQATVIKLPQELLTRRGAGETTDTTVLILAATPAATEGERRRLSLVVAEELVISMWTLRRIAADEGSGSGSGSGSSSISWSRQVVIRRREIGSRLAYMADAFQRIQLIGFGERSGTVLFSMSRTGLVQLNLGTKKVLVLSGETEGGNTIFISKELLHEIDLVSVLRCMGSF